LFVTGIEIKAVWLHIAVKEQVTGVVQTAAEVSQARNKRTQINKQRTTDPQR